MCSSDLAYVGDMNGLVFHSTNGNDTILGEDVDAIDQLIIEMDGGEIEIKKSAQAAITIDADPGITITYAVEDGVAVIRNESDRGYDVGKVIISIPEDMQLEVIRLSIGAGTLDAADLGASEVMLQVGAGEIYMDRLTTERMDVKVGAGNVSIYDSTVTKGADIKVAMGEVNFEGKMDGDMDLNCGMGMIDLNLFQNEQNNYNYDLKCGAGQIRIGGDRKSVV